MFRSRLPEGLSIPNCFVFSGHFRIGKSKEISTSRLKELFKIINSIFENFFVSGKFFSLCLTFISTIHKNKRKTKINLR